MKQATFLKIAAVAIAAPRYVGAFGVSIGVSATEQIPWLIQAELFTGGAMALLEGFALAFVWSKMALLDKTSHHYKVLLRFAWLLALTVPVVALPYLLTEQTGQTVSELFGGGIVPFVLQILWSLVVLAVPVLIVMAVGFADIDEATVQITQAKQQAEVKQVKREIKQAAFAPPALAKQTASNESTEVICDCGEVCKNSRAWAGHQAHCKLKQNGRAKQLPVPSGNHRP